MRCESAKDISDCDRPHVETSHKKSNFDIIDMQNVIKLLLEYIARTIGIARQTDPSDQRTKCLETKDPLVAYLARAKLADYIARTKLAEYLARTKLAEYPTHTKRTRNPLADRQDPLTEYLALTRQTEAELTDHLAEYFSLTRCTETELADPYLALTKQTKAALADYLSLTKRTIDPLAECLSRQDPLSEYLALTKQTEAESADPLTEYLARTKHPLVSF